MQEKVYSNVERLRKSVEEFYGDLKVGINVNDAQPGGGKTYGFVQHVRKHPNRELIFFSSNHDHLNRLERDLKNINIPFIHWEGFARKCPRYPKTRNRDNWKEDESFVYQVRNKFVNGVTLLCKTCDKKESCPYKKQFTEKTTVVLSPLEFIFRKDIVEKFDEIWIDESVRKVIGHNWDFSLERFKKFMKALEETGGSITNLEEYCKTLTKFHKIMLEKLSIIFTRPATELLEFINGNNKLYYGKEWVDKGILRNGDYVTHYAKIKLLWKLVKLKEYDRYFLLNVDSRVTITSKINSIIQKALQNGDFGRISENYVYLPNYFKFLDAQIYNDPDSGAVIVNEKIEIIEDRTILKSKEVLKETDEFERGFIGDTPYFLDKKKDRYLISNIGKGYSQDIGKMESRKNSFFTFGQPYIMEVFEIAKHKPVVLMDASFNKTVFKQHLRRCTRGDIIKKSYEKINIRYLNTSPISNKASKVYKILTTGGKDPNYSMTTLKCNTSRKGKEMPGAFQRIYPKLRKLISSLKKNNNKVGVITRIRFERDFAEICGKKLTNHFFNQRGTNRFAEVDYLIVFGTPFVPPRQVLFSHVLNFGKIPQDTSTTGTNKFDGYQDPLLNELLKIEVYDELYQAIHRCRPLLNNKIIICYCKIPAEIEMEFTCKKLKFKECMAEIFGHKEHYLENRDEVRDIINNSVTVTDYDELKGIIENDKLVERLREKWGLSKEDTEKIIDNAFDPVKAKILNLLHKSRYKKIGLTKLREQAGTQAGYSRKITGLAIAMFEKSKDVNVKREGNRKIVELRKI